MKILILTALTMIISFTAFPQNWEKIDSVFAPSGVTVQRFSAPVFGDLDGDGDYDLVIGNIELEIEYFENIGTNTEPKYRKDTSMFKSIYAGGYQFTNSDYPALADLDGDGDLDLVISGYNGLIFYENIGTPAAASWQKVDSVFADINLLIGTDARPAFVDLDNDGDLDLVIGIGESLFGGPTAGTSMGFRNNGDVNNPNFVQDNSLVTGIPDVGLNAYPAFADLDNDGDYDLLMGRDGAALYYYKNTGTPSAPVWTRDFNLFSGVETTNYWKDPTFCDLDGDGDFDLIYGTDDGHLYFYENTGTASAPQYQYNSSYFRIIKPDAASSVSFADYDNDGDLDLLSGSILGQFFYAKNNGTANLPGFMVSSAGFTNINGGFRSTPKFVDIDGDSDYDIVSGASNGTLKLYINNNGSFVQNTAMFDGITVPYESYPAFADIDGDGDLDLLIGADDPGTTKFYLNDGNNNFIQNTTMFSGVTFPRGSKPAFGDVDNDGDYDLAIGLLFGGAIHFYENTGTKFVPVWTRNDGLLEGIRAKQGAAPGFADLDNDGRIDLIVGEYDGNLTFYRNLFAIVPVELISFTGSSKGHNITLTWQTATETNNFGFEIERAAVYADQNLDWRTVGFVEGKGTTTENHSYSFSQKDLFSGKYVFRLKQVDYDGTFEYSSEVELIVGIPEVFSLEQNFPNPFNPETKIRFNVPNGDQHVTIKVYDILGNEIAFLVNEKMPAGIHEVDFNAANLPTGVYIYKLKSGSFESAKKMILAK
jgi:hypothetical protein